MERISTMSNSTKRPILKGSQGKSKTIRAFFSVRARRIFIALTICLIGSALALVTIPNPAAHANFSGAIANCLARWDYSNHQANFVGGPIQVDGAWYTNWKSPAGLYNLDVFWVFGGGSTRIDYWGATKWASGDPTPAPQGWPLPGANEYALLVGLPPGSTASLLDYSTGRTIHAGGWIQAGSISDCIVVQGGGDVTLRFSINDPNLGDNAGGPIASVYQYW
jgi:hypothetical protein